MASMLYVGCAVNDSRVSARTWHQPKFCPFLGLTLCFCTATLTYNVQVCSPSSSSAQLAYQQPWVHLWKGLERLLLRMRTLWRVCDTLLTTCCHALVVVHGIPPSVETCTYVIVMKRWTLRSTKYSACSRFWSLVRKGMTRSVLRRDCGMLGMSRAYQKSSVKWHVRYPCLIIGAHSIFLLICGLMFSFPLFVGNACVAEVPFTVGFER